MESNDLIKIYCEARDYLFQTMAEKVDVYLTEIWDPLIKIILITNRILYIWVQMILV